MQITLVQPYRWSFGTSKRAILYIYTSVRGQILFHCHQSFTSAVYTSHSSTSLSAVQLFNPIPPSALFVFCLPTITPTGYAVSGIAAREVVVLYSVKIILFHFKISSFSGISERFPRFSSLGYLEILESALMTSSTISVLKIATRPQVDPGR